MNVNREHKNSVFTALFNDQDKARELYSALTGAACDPALPVVIATLRDVLYMNQMNDLAFIVGSMLVFIIEHQSSLNHNMPLRILLYFAELCKRFVDRKALYKTTLVKIPRPKFIVLYNGAAAMPDTWEERLSDALMGTEGGGKNSLDLVVTMYNINKGRNPELLSRSATLAGYAEFVARVREYEKALPLDRAVTEAVRSCVRDGILAEFLQEHGAEVMNMVLTEWNLEEAKEVWREEGLEEGWEKGRKETEAKYQPVIVEKNRALAEKDRENQAIKREIEELRRKLRGAGID